MSFRFHEKTILRRPDAPLEVRHLALGGSNYYIGKKLGEIARKRHGIVKSGGDPLRIRCQRLYLERNYPIFHERMCGLADAYGIDLESDATDFSVPGEQNLASGCSAVHYPPAVTADAHGLVSSNLDFFTPMLTRPYIVELRPDSGHASLSIMSFELLGEALGGINAEGLVALHLADDESYLEHAMEPVMGTAVGLNELKGIQLLLDTCADVREAKEALLLNKHFYMHQPVHLLVADRFGHSFVWEYSHAHNQEHIIDGNGAPQVVTNFLLHRYGSIAEVPLTSADRGCPYNRYRTLRNAVASGPEKVSRDFIRETSALVFMDDRSFQDPPPMPVRTMLHVLYDTAARRLEVSFHLEDGSGGEPGAAVRSPSFTFALDAPDAGGSSLTA